MQSKSLAKRMIQTCAAVNLDRFRDGVLPPEKQKRVWEATEKVQASKIYTEHYVRNVEELRSKARMHKRKHFIEWIVIDYPAVGPWDSRMKKRCNSRISHQIKLMAMELDLPIILLAQVNREGAKRETGLTLHDLKIAETSKMTQTLFYCYGRTAKIQMPRGCMTNSTAPTYQ